MPKNTRLSGHGLRAEGKPFVWSSNRRRWVRADTRDGSAMCSCGTVSQMLHSDAERKRWMNIHKDQIRASLSADASEEG